jgi:hypothetical protein
LLSDGGKPQRHRGTEKHRVFWSNGEWEGGKPRRASRFASGQARARRGWNRGRRGVRSRCSRCSRFRDMFLSTLLFWGAAVSAVRARGPQRYLVIIVALVCEVKGGRQPSAISYQLSALGRGASDCGLGIGDCGFPEMQPQRRRGAEREAGGVESLNRGFGSGGRQPSAISFQLSAWGGGRVRGLGFGVQEKRRPKLL